jgi:hypothetical protein
MEGVLLIATIAQEWKMRLAPDQRVETKPMITLRAKYGMRMVLQPRERLVSSREPVLAAQGMS